MLFTEICRGIAFSVLANSVQLSIFYDWQLNLLFLPLCLRFLAKREERKPDLLSGFLCLPGEIKRLFAVFQANLK